MWVTIVRDVIGAADRRALVDAVEEIASPLDTYGWSSAGVYFFWDVDTREVLYIGLAVDLALRLGQHFGIVGCPASGCKRDKIDEWFATHDRLGYSIALQTSNVQPVCSRLAAQLNIDLAIAKFDPTIDLDPLPGELHAAEGRMIEHHRLTKGALPPWNRIGGSRRGAKDVQDTGPDDMFDIVVGRKDGVVVARRSIRELAVDFEAAAYEEHLHAVRLHLAMFGSGDDAQTQKSIFVDLLMRLPDGPLDPRARMLADGYLRSPAPFAVHQHGLL